MSFQLSDAVNRDRVFLVKRSELEGRLDPNYFKLINEFKYHLSTPFKNVGHFFEVKDGDHNKFPPEEVSDSENGVRYLRSQDLKDGKLINEAPVYVSKKYFKSIKRSHIKPGDILFSIMASVGSIAIVPDDFEICTANRAVGILTKKRNVEINSYYIQALFNTAYGVKLLNLLKKGGIQQRINLSDLSTLEIPVPSTGEQSKIATYLVDAFHEKQRKETEAQRLIDSFDTYLFNELGIMLPVKEENSIKQRMFIRKFSDVSGGRFDAPGNWIKLSLKSGVFDNVPFSEVVAINPVTDFGFSDNSTPATFLPMESISELYAEANITQTREIGEAKGYTTFQEGDLLWAKITPCMENGKSAVVQNLTNGIGFGSTEYHVFRSYGSVNIHYIHALLRLNILRSTAVNSFSGSAGHQRVDELFFRKLSIPLPPLERQNEIADHIKTIRDQAKQLRYEAAAGLEKAKQEVEAMILGDPCQ